jgi:nucleoside-diphosphate-sugar epimerase
MYETWAGSPQDTRPATLVTNPDSKVGQHVVAALLSRGERVRVLCDGNAAALRQQLTRQPVKAPATLSAVVLGPQQAMQPGMLRGVRAVIHVAAAEPAADLQQLRRLLRCCASQVGTAEGAKLLDPGATPH